MAFFTKKEKKDVQVEKVKRTKKIDLVVSYDEKDGLAKFLAGENIYYFFESIGHGNFKLSYHLEDEERIEQLLNEYYEPEPLDDYDDELLKEKEIEIPEEYSIDDFEKLVPEELIETQEDAELTEKSDLKKLKVEPMQPKQPRKKLNRTIELKARFTEQEVAAIEEKIKISGLKKGEFIRKSLLEQEIREIDKEKMGTNTDALLDLKAEIGRVGGLLKSFIKPNMENHNVSAEDMSEIKKQLNELERLKKKIDREVKRTWQS